MGASKEGTMSVRDKILSAIREEEDDPPDTSTSSREGEARSAEFCVPRVPGDEDDTEAVSQESVSSSSLPTVSESTSNSGGDKVSGGKRGSPQLRISEGVTTKSPKVRTSGSSGTGDNNSLILESCLTKEDVRRVEEVLDGGVDHKEQLITLKDLLKQHFRVIRSLKKRLISSESAFEALEKERDQLQETLNCERQANVDFRSETEITLKSKDERIQELEQELAVARARKATEDKETCITPPPPAPPPPLSFTPPRYHSKRTPTTFDDEFLNAEDDDDLGFPKSKRAKLDSGRRETTSSNFLVPPPAQKSYFKSSSYLSPHPSQRRSDSPPRLSPAVTPKSTLSNMSSGRPRDIKSFLGEEMHDDTHIGAPDEFQDELERINRRRLPSSPGQVNNRSSADNHVSGDQYPNSYSPRAQNSLYPASSSSPSYSPYNSKPPKSRFMFPDTSGKKRFQNSGSSFQPTKSRFQHANSPEFPFSKGSSSNFKNLTQHAIKNRSNNFLNLSRPLPKKAPVVIVPTPQSQTTPPTSYSHFRSLDGVAANAASTSSSSQSFQYSQHHHHYHPSEEEQGALVPSKTPPAAKKRKVGRPPGSFKSKVVIPRSSLSSSFSSPSSSSGTPQQQSGQLPNGSIINLPEPPTPPPPPPQRFSQRGRLLKPNRARYSPDPDISVNTTPREKFMTTKRGYFVGEPFVQPSFPDEDDQSDLLDHDDSSFQFSSPPPIGDTLMEYEPFLLTPGPESEFSKSKPEALEDESTTGEGGAFVEVPKWRVNDITGIPETELSPEDDMSDEAYLKRHQKLEAKEKQRKRWDSQRMREESYLERLKRKQEERERQKELRRQQRKRNKARNGASEEESVTPSVEDIKAVHIGTELPLMWNVTPVATATESAPTPPPPQQGSSTTKSDEGNSMSRNASEKGSPKSGSPVHDPLENDNYIPSPATTPTIPPSSSSPSSSSLSLLSIPSPGAPTPPPEIFPADDEIVMDQGESPTRTEDNTFSSGRADDLIIVYEGNEDECEHPYPDDDDDPDRPMECPSSPVFTVDLVDYVNSEVEELNDDNNGKVKGEDFAGAETCDISSNPVAAAPSISIPLQTSTSLLSPTRESPLELANTLVTPSTSCSTITRTLTEAKPRNSTVVRFPQMMSFSPSKLPSVTLASPQSSSTPVSKTSITFFIPNNPLAPRHQRSSAPINRTSSSSAKTPPITPSRPECCKDS